MDNEADSYDGIVRQNVVFMTGICLTSVAAGATNFEKAAVISIAFSLISFYTIILARLVPRKIVYTIRIIIYALMSAAIYIPVVTMLNSAFGKSVVESVGVYLPILVTNPLILSKTESRFYRRSARSMVGDVFSFVIGFDIACLATGTIRDLLAHNAIGVYNIDMPFDIPALDTTFGGFILLGVMSGMWRAAYNASRTKKNAGGS